MSPRQAAVALSLSALALAATSCDPPGATPLNFAAAFGWRGYADTDLPFADFWGADHTVMLRFMVDYPFAYTAPFVGDSGSNAFWIGKDGGKPQIAVNLGGLPLTFSMPQVQGRAWHHLAWVRGGGQFTFYLDGSQICPDGGACSVGPGTGVPTGNLRLGRLMNGATVAGRDAQLYGFIDDLAVFKLALSAQAIGIFSQGDRLTGSESSLFAGWTFDDLTPSGAALPPVLQRGVTFATLTPGAVLPGTPAYKALVTQGRDDAQDQSYLPVPFQQTALRLPFPAGEAWQVIQGWDNPGGSHNGAASFCWDFVLAGHPQADSLGKPIYAAAGGMVAEVRNDRPSCSGYPASYAMITHAPLEVGAYLHFVMGSVLVAANQPVAVGAQLAQCGDTGNTSCGAYHLHFSLHTLPESQAGTLVTFPSAFSNYEVSTDQGNSWSPIARGVPRNGDWVRNPP